MWIKKYSVLNIGEFFENVWLVINIVRDAELFADFIFVFRFRNKKRVALIKKFRP